MKPSHLTTPRSLNECHFTPGYRCAERDNFTELGWTLLNYFTVGIALGGVLVLLLSWKS